jgi:DNA-binding NtrC family response regulator
LIVTSAAGSQAVSFDEQHAFAIDVPPLRGRSSRIDPEALRLLVADRWPDNVHELRSVIERALTFTAGDAVPPGEFPAHLLQRQPLGPPLPPAGTPSAAPFEPALDLRAQLKQHEQELIRLALERTNGHQRKAAELLGLPLRTLERKLQKLSKRPARSH